MRDKVHSTLLAMSKGLLAPAEASAAWPCTVPVHVVGLAGLGRGVSWPARGSVVTLFPRPQEDSLCLDSSGWDKHSGDIGGLRTIHSCHFT